VTVTDKNTGQAIPMALVRVYNASFQWGHNTGDNGIATFQVYNNTLYQVSASKTGYNPLSKYVTVISGTVATTELQLTPTFVKPTTTVTTAIPTATPTIPGYTPAPGGAVGNFTGFWAPFQNLAIAMGADPGYVGILMALVLTFGGLIVGSIGPSMFTSTIVVNPIGGEVGALLGITSSVAFGFFPVYMAIIVVVCLILYVSLRVYGVTR
jgi:hypothetical protein